MKDKETPTPTLYDPDYEVKRPDTASDVESGVVAKENPVTVDGEGAEGGLAAWLTVFGAYV